MSATQEIVVGLNPAIMPFGYGKGHPTKKILTDGVRFYCAGNLDTGEPCGDHYVGNTFGQVMAHRSGGHGARKARNQAAKASGGTVEQTLAEIKARAQALIQDVDSIESRLTHPDGTTPKDGKVSAEWKQRALKAERALRSIQKAVGVTS